MGALIRDGHLVVKNGKPVIGTDFSCCCGACCCRGSLACCDALDIFPSGMNCGGASHSIQVRWQWQVNGAFCRFVWDITDLSLVGYNGANGYADYLEPNCDAVNGAWVFDEFLIGEHGKFFGTNTMQPFARCNWEGATVTITKVAGGYQFDVAGVTSIPGWGCNCDGVNGTYVVEC